ncbi:hypothetical protein EVAR_3917_1 [Eumeta japonica]|uniref:Uncharacterized protein n=1 Tax=Eumeta variegata TaxID=151549 RepID=A0A4C1STM5_EUMVA|nr:hypothetical protein EVAR_3917_1 [Eumeta japonica]
MGNSTSQISLKVERGIGIVSTASYHDAQDKSLCKGYPSRATQQDLNQYSLPILTELQAKDSYLLIRKESNKHKSYVVDIRRNIRRYHVLCISTNNAPLRNKSELHRDPDGDLKVHIAAKVWNQMAYNLKGMAINIRTKGGLDETNADSRQPAESEQ